MSEIEFGASKHVNKNVNGNPYPKQCRYCRHFGNYRVWFACYDVSLLHLAFLGPKIVAYDGYCSRFRYHKNYGGRSR
ncbi:hypothetical protein HDR61_00770 [bacterium]|nr:hypothetical protein [bacterium]